MATTSTNANGSTPIENGNAKDTKDEDDDDDLLSAIETVIPKNLSTAALEQRHQTFLAQSQQHSSALTQKLASSQSGQDLLHIGTSLSTLPPDLHHLLTHLHPLGTSAEQAEQGLRELLTALGNRTTNIRRAQLRAQQARQCAELYTDLGAAEAVIAQDVALVKALQQQEQQNESQEPSNTDLLYHLAALERTAHVALCLKCELEAATASPQPPSRSTNNNNDAMASARAPLDPDPEFATFTVQLAPRIRNLETDVGVCLSRRLEWLLPRRAEFEKSDNNDNNNNKSSNGANDNDDDTDNGLTVYLMLVGHAMRGLATLGRSSTVEHAVLQAIAPLIRQHLSMGRLDQGGGRGECTGLASMLDDICASVNQQYGPVLRSAIRLFDCCETTSTTTSDDNIGDNNDIAVAVDLVTGSVWVPLATALLEDAAGLTMAIFSAGIASIIHANYKTMDAFLHSLAERLLTTVVSTSDDDDAPLSAACIARAQERIYAHPKTAELNKKWNFNLNIYYQLRFGEACQRLDTAITTTQTQGWSAQLTSSPAATTTNGTTNGDTAPDAVVDPRLARAKEIQATVGYEVALFVEHHDLMTGLWRSDVVLRPLTNRFLRGAVQLLGRLVAFCDDGLQGKILFGEEPPKPTPNGQPASNGSAPGAMPPPPISTAKPRYNWGESERDVAAVAWELTILETTVRHDYVDVIAGAIGGPTDTEEIRGLVGEVLEEATETVYPIIDRAWNELIVNILTTKCTGPLSAVKGVAATYRMTNRPPPKQASPFVGTILRPLSEFATEFSSRTPEKVGNRWKQHIVVTVSDRYAAAVRELIDTVQRTEATLQNRGTRRKAAGGRMSDGEKVKLQLFLDYEAYVRHVEEVGVDPATVIGVSKLKEMTSAGEALANRGTTNGTTP